jgi:hypothetical protein
LIADCERMHLYALFSSKHRAVMMWVNDIANCCRTGAERVSENVIHRKVVRALVRSPNPLRIGLALHIGVARMTSATS